MIMSEPEAHGPEGNDKVDTTVDTVWRADTRRQTESQSIAGTWTAKRDTGSVTFLVSRPCPGPAAGFNVRLLVDREVPATMPASRPPQATM